MAQRATKTKTAVKAASKPMPKRIHALPDNVPEGTIHVDGGRFANPFKVGAIVAPPGEEPVKLETAADCAAMFRHAFENDWMWQAKAYPSRAIIRSELAGRDLASTLSHDDDCHADVLLEIANAA